ncbi:MAG TPA: aldo/keto reductase [Methylomirabilota bacterium]|nr:aldo/keto reductase [Methylomirabilota bacterium]
MIYRTLGRTGERVSAIGLGGYHLGDLSSEQECIRVVRKAIDGGITFMDNCWDYHDGKSEVWMGNALRDGYRDKVYLMTKIDGQTHKAATNQINDCLKRLQTDRIDLMQFHEMIRPEDPERVFRKGGAFDAVIEAQRAGKIRHIGFTGHKDPVFHLAMLERARQIGFTFDAVQMPLNVMDAHFRSFEKLVLPELLKDNIGVLGMKPLGAGAIVQKAKALTAIECLHYALNLPTSTVITGIDKPQYLDQAFEAVNTFKPLNKEQVDSMLARSAPFARQGEFEQFKTTTDFDGTVQNPHWLGLDQAA